MRQMGWDLRWIEKVNFGKKEDTLRGRKEVIKGKDQEIMKKREEYGDLSI